MKVPDHAALAAEVEGMTTAQLRQELSRGLRLAADNLLRLALVVKALEARGEDLSGLRVGLLLFLRQIAAGQLLPEVVVRFAGVPSLIERIGRLPHDEQRRLADGGQVTIVTAARSGFAVEQKDPLALTPRQIGLAFAPDHLRSEEEQKEWLDARPIVSGVNAAKGRTRKAEEYSHGPEPAQRTALDAAFSFAATAGARDLAERLADVLLKHEHPRDVLAFLNTVVHERLKDPRRKRRDD
jgi:hypothetical protein